MVTPRSFWLKLLWWLIDPGEQDRIIELELQVSKMELELVQSREGHAAACLRELELKKSIAAYQNDSVGVTGLTTRGDA